MGMRTTNLWQMEYHFACKLVIPLFAGLAKVNEANPPFPPLLKRERGILNVGRSAMHGTVLNASP